MKNTELQNLGVFAVSYVIKQLGTRGAGWRSCLAVLRVCLVRLAVPARGWPGGTAVVLGTPGSAMPMCLRAAWRNPASPARS